jgi:transcription elongation factor GreA
MTDSSYLTRKGAKKLQEELQNLKGPAREGLAKRLRTAIQQGDLSENADYLSAKEEQGFLEGRILDLENTLQNVVIIEDNQTTSNQIGIGSRFVVKENGGDEDTYYLVGPKEADPIKGMISFESPIGKALMGHSVGDEVEVLTPGGKLILAIVKLI